VPYLRENALKQPPRKWAPAPLQPAPRPRSHMQKKMSTRDARRVRPINEHPLLWKEMYHQALPFFALRSFRKDLFTALALVGLPVVATWAVVSLFRFLPEDQQSRRFFAAWDHYFPLVLNAFVRGATVVLAGLYCILAGLHAAGSITVEREQRTLASLLLLPFARLEILAAKALGNIGRYRILGACLLAVWVVGMGTGAVHPAAAVLLAAACGIHLVFLACLGVWISLVSRNSLWAYSSMVLMLLVVFIGWLVVMLYAQFFFRTVPGGSGWWNGFIEIGLNPARTWWALSMSWPEMDQPLRNPDGSLGTFSATLAGVSVFALLAAVLALCAYVEFRKEQPITSN
jgi:ABC-type transport system involved in multi-copper enzyme maturation permease subunit